MQLSRREILRSCGAIAIGGTLGAQVRIEAAPAAIARLNHNENAFGPSQRAKDALLAIGDEAWRYPQEELFALRRLIAEQEGVRPENVFIGEGSGEVLKLAALLYAGPGKTVLAARPTFAMLPEYAARQGASVAWIDVNAAFDQDFAAMAAAVGPATSVVYVCNPNNPTGALADDGKLRSFVLETAKHALVVVDEAYLDYAADSERATLSDLVRANHSVLITRSFSKLHGLAGLRIGYGLARTDIVRRLETARMSIPNRAGVAAARASLGDQSFRSFVRARNGEAVRFVRGVLDELKLPYVPTQASFVMFDVGRSNAEFVEFARQRRVLVAPVAAPFSQWVRVSMGRPEDLQAFANALRAFVRAA
jgi:histidinol-phosphate aminotransferase